MKTASFFTYTGPGRVSIARWAPRGTPAGFRVYRPLNPTAPMLKMTRADYEPLYQAILAKLDPRQVADDLHRLTDPHEGTSKNLRFEKSAFVKSGSCIINLPRNRGFSRCP